MPRGGKREGAGRKPLTPKTGGSKPGAVTVRTRKVADRLIQDGGETPLEMMLANARHFFRLALDAEAMLADKTAMELGGAANLSEKEQFDYLLAEVRKAADLRERCQAAARDAARYMHAPIAAKVVGGDTTADRPEPIAERVAKFEREKAIAASGPKVVELKR